VEIILSKPEGLDLEWTKVVALHLHLFFILNAKVCTTEKIEIKLTFWRFAKAGIFSIKLY
jgi:hypothetical protein